MSASFVLEVACDPIGKARPRFSTRGGFARAITPEKTRRYEAVLRQEAAVAMGNRPLLDGALDVLIHAVMPIPPSWSKKKRAEASLRLIHPTGKPDLTNIGKAAEDALNGIVWKDDAQITRLTVLKEYGDCPRIIIRARSIAGAAS